MRESNNINKNSSSSSSRVPAAAGGVGVVSKISGKSKGAAQRDIYPWDVLCDDIATAFKEGQDIVLLQRFEDLQALAELDTLLDGSEEREAALEKVEFSWGRAILAAKRIAGDDDDEEHAAEIVESFEERFQRPSDYLRVLAITADGALEALRIHQLIEGRLSTEAVSAALHRFPALGGGETKDLLEFLKSNDVPITGAVAEQLEKNFVVRMKNEDAEDVLAEMRAAGVEPMSTRPYSFIFMKSTPFKYMTPIEYYEDMLDRGITPENSTFRILSKHTQHIGFLNNHFSTLAWGKSAPQRRREEDEGGSTQLFFASRLEDLAKANPEATLDDAVKVLRRMRVEGTPLTNGSPVLSILLSHFCRSGHPEDTERVLSIAQEYDCRPTSATLLKLLKNKGPEWFNQTEAILSRVSDAGELLPPDCVDLLRHFVLNNMRSRAVRVFRAFVLQTYRHPSEPIMFPIASMAMKLGPFDWALGVLAMLLATVDKPLGRGVQTRMRDCAHDGRSRDVLAVLERGEWKRDQLLLSPEMQEPTGSAGQGENHKPTWISALHIALVEVGVEKEVIQAYKAMLTSAIDAARRHKNQNE